jgi:two-component system chemotaxis response regulator CheY
MKILVVDDSKLSRQWAIQALPDMLTKHAKIFEADDGEKAIECYKKENPDLVLMDITMPNKNGFEALEEILAYDSKATVENGLNCQFKTV